MKKITFTLILLFIFGYSYSKNEGLIRVIKEEVQKISTSFPSGFENNIKNIQETTSL